MTVSQTQHTLCQGVFLIILLIFSSLGFQGIYASQIGNEKRAVDSNRQETFMSWRKYALERDNTSVLSSVINDYVQGANNRSLILQQMEDENRFETHDIPSDNMGTTDSVVEELKNFNVTQIRDFPLYQLSSDDLLVILTDNILLGDKDLQRILGNTKPENLKVIFDSIPQEFHESILDRLDLTTKTYVQNSIGESMIS